MAEEQYWRLREVSVETEFHDKEILSLLTSVIDELVRRNILKPETIRNIGSCRIKRQTLERIVSSLGPIIKTPRCFDTITDLNNQTSNTFDLLLLPATLDSATETEIRVLNLHLQTQLNSNGYVIAFINNTGPMETLRRMILHNGKKPYSQIEKQLTSLKPIIKIITQGGNFIVIFGKPTNELERFTGDPITYESFVTEDTLIKQ